MAAEQINPDYGKLSAQTYIDKVNSPSRSIAYAALFRFPIIETARSLSATGKVTVLNVACGHAYEMDFLGEPVSSWGQPVPNEPIQLGDFINFVGLDISHATLASSSRKRLVGNNVHFLAADTEFSPLVDDFADVGIALNAVIYKPDHILKTLFNALKPGKRCIVNFRIYGNPYNTPFYDFYLERGGELIDQELIVKTAQREERFGLKVVDYRNSTDEQDRILDRQAYFQSVEDIERLIDIIGFKLDKREQFHYESPANPDNEIEVFTLQKPN